MYYKINSKTEQFLKKFVYSCSSFKSITEDNASDIVDFIVIKYVSPLSNLEDKGIKFDQNILNDAEDAITDITSNPLW